MDVTVNIKFLNSDAKMPTRGSEYAAGYDLYAATEYDIEITPHNTVKIPTGIAMELPEGTFGGIFARSGLATKKGLRPANCVAVIDSDYRGEILVPIHNDTDKVATIEAGDRIAQLIILPFIEGKFNVVDTLNETVRGVNGFGSTGVK